MNARMESRIVLRRSQTGWTATFSGPCAREVVQHFGTDTLPTPYTPRAPAHVVRDALAILNPDAVVEVAQ